MKRIGLVISAQPQLAVLLVLIFVASVTLERFLSPMNISAIAFQYSLFGFLALGQLFVILTRGIDLSQGAILAVACMAVAAGANMGGMAAGIIAGLLTGTAFGLMNGAVVSFTKIPPFVATLGMMGIARGVALTITDSVPVRLLDKNLADVAWTKFASLPIVAWIFLAGVVLVAAFLHFHIIGRHLYAVGGHEENARLSGVRPRVVKISAYAVSGLFCGIAAVFLTARLGTGHPLAGRGWELESIAAAIIGGAGLMGGSGKALGVASGVLILGVIDSMINIIGISPYFQGALKGGIILIAISLSASSLNLEAIRQRLRKTMPTSMPSSQNQTRA